MRRLDEGGLVGRAQRALDVARGDEVVLQVAEAVTRADQVRVPRLRRPRDGGAGGDTRRRVGRRSLRFLQRRREAFIRVGFGDELRCAVHHRDRSQSPLNQKYDSLKARFRSVGV